MMFQAKQRLTETNQALRTMDKENQSQNRLMRQNSKERENSSYYSKEKSPVLNESKKNTRLATEQKENHSLTHRQGSLSVLRPVSAIGNKAPCKEEGNLKIVERSLGSVNGLLSSYFLDEPIPDTFDLFERAWIEGVRESFQEGKAEFQ
jgi:hypothetical protein